MDSENRQSKITTKTIFGKKLHKYTIANAINDNNVLKFKVSYPDDIKIKPNQDKTISKSSIVDWILANHHKKCAKQKFNAIFATSSINSAIEYYNLFKAKQADLPNEEKLNIACVFSPPNYNGQKELTAESENYKEQALFLLLTV